MQLRWRVLLTAATISSVAALAACGGGTPGAGGGSVPEGAALLAPGTPVFVAIDSDFESQQWQAAQALLARFPSGEEAIESLFSELGDEGLGLETRSALGPEVDVALFDLSEEEPTVVLLTQPSDPAELEALLAQEDDPPAWREVDGWYVVARDEAAIDAALARGGESLADSDAFAEAMGGLEGEALARLYVDGPALIAGLEEAAESAGPSPFEVFGSTGQLESVALSVVAEQRGVRLEGVVRSEGAPEAEPAPAELLELAPGDALVFASFHGLDQGLAQLLDAAGRQTPDFEQSLGQAEALLGVSLRDDVLPIFGGEGAFWVRGGTPVPEITVVLSPDDPARALATFDKLVGAVALFGALGGEDGGSPPVTATDTTIAGVPAKTLPLDDDFSLYYAEVDGRLVITTAEQGIADLVEGGSSLADDPAFQQAAETAGLPDETLGFVYVDLEDALGLLQTLEGFELEAGASADLRPLGYLLVHATGGGDETRFSGFLAVE